MRSFEELANHAHAVFLTAGQVQLDSITANELGDPAAIVSIPGHPEKTALQDWETTPRLGALPPCLPCAMAGLRVVTVVLHALQLPP